PFYVELESPTPPGGLPQPGKLTVTLPNNHLQYAITWFGLAVVLAAVFAAFVRARARETRAGEGPADRLGPPKAKPCAFRIDPPSSRWALVGPAGRIGPVRYISTRGEAPPLGFIDVTLAGLARDGGLYVPESWPFFPPDRIGALAGRPYPE